MADQEPTAGAPKPKRDDEYWKKQERRSWVEVLLGLGFGRVRYPDTPKPRQDAVRPVGDRPSGIEAE